ncbi:MAG: ABC transporter substrate-binding protein [Desulfobacterium sp.]|nr:ABC transporter substrate-binding protein [Desulfobacterium sp.]
MKASDPNNIQRRRFLGQAAATLGASLFSPCLPAFAAKEELRLGYLPITDAAPLLIAHSLGFFLEEGLVVPRPVMVRSWKVLAESFMAGKFDLTHMLFPMPVWMRFKQKMPVKVLGWDHTNGSAMTVHGDSDIRGFADLGGKQIAVPSWYSTHNLVLQIGLRARGLTPVIKPQNSHLKPNEVNLFILSPPEMPPALLGRKIDGFIVAEPFNALAEMKVRARIMRFTGDIWKNHPCCVLVAREELTRRRPAFVQKAVNAVVRAQLWCEQNREQAAHILSRDGEGYLPVEAKVLKRVFTGYDLKAYTTGPLPRAIMHPEWDIQRIGFQPYPFPSATRFVLEQMGKTLVEGDNSFLKNIDSARAAGELVDDSFVRKAMDSNRDYGRFFPLDVAHPLSREEIIEID